MKDPRPEASAGESLGATRRENWVSGLKTVVVLLGFAALGVALLEYAEAQQTPLPADEAPSELVTAIESYMASELEGESSGTNCQAAIDEEAPGGSWCWSLLELDGSEARVGFGQVRTDVGADPVTFVRQSDGSWTDRSSAPGAPETGTGMEARTPGGLWVAGLSAIVLAGTLAVALTLFRRTRLN